MTRNGDITAEQQVLAANAAFYAAFRNADFAAMDALWSFTAKVSVYHPGWPGIYGRDDVMASWRAILLEGTPPHLIESGEKVILNGNSAMVMCLEDLGHARTVATNTFVKEAGGWKMVHHQASGLPDADP